MRLSNISERFLAYATDQALLISLTSLISEILHIKAAFLGFFILYKINFVQGFSHIFTTYYGLENILILYILSLSYYSLSSFYNVGVSQSIFKLRVINKYNMPRMKFFRTILVRESVRAFFVLNFINALFILKYRKFLQSLIDRKLDFYVVKVNDDLNKKSIFYEYFEASIVIYYSTFLILMLIYLFIIKLQNPSIGSTGTATSFDFWDFFDSILNNNLTLNLEEYVSGGLSLFIGTFVSLFNSNILEAESIAILYGGPHGSTLLKYTLPQFFPETFGYIFGIATSMNIVDMAFSYLKSMLRNEKSNEFFERAKILVLNTGFYMAFSISLLILGALIESSLGLYNF
jgi:hypothetical protein